MENLDVASIRKEIAGDSLESFCLSDHSLGDTDMLKLLRFMTKGTAI